MSGEFKKLYGEFHVKILIFLILLTPIIIAILSVSSFSAIESAESSNKVEGREAIALYNARYQKVKGQLNVDKLNAALQHYQAISSPDLAYLETELEYPGVTGLLFDAYTNVYGEGDADLYSVTDADDFYTRNISQIREILYQRAHEYEGWEKGAIIKKAESLNIPYNLDFAMQWKVAFISLSILLFLFSISALLIGARIFSYEKEKRMDLILATIDKKGLRRIGKNKIVAYLTFLSAVYALMVILFSGVYFTLTGVTGWNSHLQTEYFISVNEMTFAQAYITVLLVGWICILAIGMLAVIINAFVHTSLSTLVLGTVLIYCPLIMARLDILPLVLKKLIQVQPVNGLMPERILTSLHLYRLFSIDLSVLSAISGWAGVSILVLGIISSISFAGRISRSK